MKTKKNLLIIACLFVVLLVAILIGYQIGKNTEPQTATNSTTEKESNTQTQEESDEPSDESMPPESTISHEEDSEENTTENTQEDIVEDTPQSEKTPITDDAFTASIDSANSWGDNPVFHQLNITLYNDTDKDINGWCLRIQVGESAVIDNGRSGNYSIENDTLVVTNVDYNALIPSKGSCEIGIILSGITGDLSYTIEALGTQAPTVVNNNQNNNQQNNQTTPSNPGMLEVPEPTTDDWLHVEGNRIVDSTGKQVWLTGVNWFGYNTGSNIFDGIWNSDLNTSIQSIADHGFNLIRIPMSAELILKWKNGEYPTANYNHATNYYLESMNSLEIFDYIIGQCRASGMKIMIDIHSAKTDSMGHMSNMWYNGDITTEKYQEALVWMAERYAKDDTIIAYDLKNEPHGKPYEEDKAIWNDSKDKNNWKYVAEQTALKILEKNPNVLIMVEGTEIYPVNIKSNSDYSSTNDKDYYFNWWGGNLRGVADYPVDLGKYQSQLVYSPHDYGPTVYQQPWFSNGYNYNSLYEDCWHDNWLYIHENGTAPLLIGEWGGFMREPNLTWMTHLRTLISEYKLHHTFWCFNANSGDTGGLVLDDFQTWDEEKYAFVKEVLWQENGKFVGLDHQIPLGTAGNGITLSDATGIK